MEDLEQLTKDLLPQVTPGAPETETITIPDIAQAVAQVEKPITANYDICPICGMPMCRTWMNAPPGERQVMLLQYNAARGYVREYRMDLNWYPTFGDPL